MFPPIDSGSRSAKSSSATRATLNSSPQLVASPCQSPPLRGKVLPDRETRALICKLSRRNTVLSFRNICAPHEGQRVSGIKSHVAGLSNTMTVGRLGRRASQSRLVGRLRERCRLNGPAPHDRQMLRSAPASASDIAVARAGHVGRGGSAGAVPRLTKMLGRRQAGRTNASPSNNSALLFFGLFTHMPTGHTFSTSSPDRLNSAAGSSSTSPSQSSGSRITGIWP
jgi:hypothetical protein